MSKKKYLYTVVGYDEKQDAAIVDYDEKAIKELIAVEVFGKVKKTTNTKKKKKTKRSKKKKK